MTSRPASVIASERGNSIFQIMFGKFMLRIRNHKALASLVLIAVAGGGYAGSRAMFGDSGAVRYATAHVVKGTLVVSLSGSGQVSVERELDMKSKASGDVVFVGAKSGDEAKAGAAIFTLDARDAQKGVRDAEANLASARIALQKLKKPADALTLLQAEHALAQAQESKKNAEDNLKKAYEDGFGALANAFLDFPDVMGGLEDVFYATTLAGSSGGQYNIDYYADAAGRYDDVMPRMKDVVSSAIRAARAAYDSAFTSYHAASRFSDGETVEALILQTYDAAKLLAEAVKNGEQFMQRYRDALLERNARPNAAADTHIAALGSHTAKTNSVLSNLLGAKRAVEDGKDAIVNAGRALAERTASFAKIKAGPDLLDLESQALAVRSRENALSDAREKLADYTVRAPFDGILAKLNVKKGDAVSSGAAVGTFVAKQKLAEISLSEVDVAQIAVGQKATLTFDALPDFSITGRVAEVDFLGTVSQGVVTYAVKIAFDTQDERVKSGMSVSAAIVTSAKQNALMAPNAAVKQQGETSYVEAPDDADRSAATANVSGVVFQNSTRRIAVEVGAASDEYTEILSGVAEGDLVVTRTIQPNAGQTQSQTQQGGLRIPGIPGGGGGFNRPVMIQQR